MDVDVKQDLHILTIQNATLNDEGAYRLKVVNEKGSVSVTVMVTAKVTEDIQTVETPKEELKIEVKQEPEPCKPKIEVAPEPVEFSLGETITLSCKASG